MTFMSDRIPLMLIPGLLLTEDLWRDQMADLADIAEVTVADHTTHDNLPELVAAILEGAPDRFALGALSFGGYLAFEIMRQAPERILGLALIDTSARKDTDQQAQHRRDFIKLAKSGRFLGVTEGLIKTFIHPDRHGDREIIDRLTAMAQSVGPDAFIRQEMAILERPDSVPDLAGYGCPALVLCGRQDARTPIDHHEEMADAIPDADLVILSRCGHLAPMERPRAVSDAMRAWLGRI